MTRVLGGAGAIAVTLAWFGCQAGIDVEQERRMLLQVDREFAAASAELGFVEAYRRYLDDDATVMPPEQSPVSGRAEIYATWSNQFSDERLGWEPQGGSVATSADLGWTWGHWTFSAVDDQDPAQRSSGTYVFIWKRVGGGWKVVANIWNSGPRATSASSLVSDTL